MYYGCLSYLNISTSMKIKMITSQFKTGVKFEIYQKKCIGDTLILTKIK